MKYKLFILFSIISYLCHGQKIKLELNLTPGKSYTQCIMAYSSGKQPQNDPKKSDSSQHQDTESYSRIIYSVVNQANSYYELKARYDSLTWLTSTQYSYNEITSGNKKKDPPPLSALQAIKKSIVNDKKYNDYTSVLRELLKKTFSVKMSRTGRIIEVKNIDSLINDIIDKNQYLTSNSKEVTKRELITIFGDSALKGRLIIYNPVFADSVISKGEKWQGNSTFGSKSSANALTTYELLDISDKECLISATSKVVTPNKELLIEKDGLKLKTDLEGTVTYNFKIDRSSGWVKRSKIEQYLKGTITPIINSDNNSPEVTIPVESTAKIAITN